MAPITITRALLEQALEALEIATEDYDDSAVGLEIDAIQAIRAELAKPVEQVEPAAHMFPSDLERFAESETFAQAFSVAVGSPDERSVPLYLHPPAPAWHDSPETLALKAERDAAMKDAKRLDYLQKHARCDPKMDGNHVWWPTTFNQAQNLRGGTLREAIDAAIAKVEGGAA